MRAIACRGHLLLSQHLLLDMQNSGVDLIGNQCRHVLRRDAYKIDVLWVDVGSAQHILAQNIGEAAGLLDADALACQVGHCLYIVADDHRGLKLVERSQNGLDLCILRNADGGERGRRHCDINISR